MRGQRKERRGRRTDSRACCEFLQLIVSGGSLKVIGSKAAVDFCGCRELRPLLIVKLMVKLHSKGGIRRKILLPPPPL